jgi:predicted nucleotidyltransferase
VDLPDVKGALERIPEAKLAILFGSWAIGTATAESDVDVAVSFDPDTTEVRRRAEAVLRGAVRPWVDVIHIPDAPPLLRMEIARNGRVLLERAEGGWAAFKARAMIDWGDWAPYARRQAEAAARRNRERLSHGQA